MLLHLAAKSVKSLHLEKNPSEGPNSANDRMPKASLSLKEHKKNSEIYILVQCRKLICERLGHSNKFEI